MKNQIKNKNGHKQKTKPKILRQAHTQKKKEETVRLRRKACIQLFIQIKKKRCSEIPYNNIWQQKKDYKVYNINLKVTTTNL